MISDKVVNLIRCCKLEFLFLKMNVVAISKYGISYYLSIFYELMNGLMNIVYFYIIFGNIDRISAWSKEDIYLLVAIGYFIDVVCVMLFIGTASIPDYIVTGSLDVLLTKPINHRFLLCFRRPNTVQVVNVTIASLFMTKLVMDKTPTFTTIMLFVLSLMLSVLLMYLIVSTLVYFSFWTVKIGSIWEIVEKFNSASTKPGTIYPTLLRNFMTFIIPSLIIVNYPAEILCFQRYDLLFRHTIPITIGLVILNKFVFKYGLRHYSGAGG